MATMGVGFFARIESNNLYFDRAVKRGVTFGKSPDYTRAYAAFASRLLPKGTLLAVGCGDGSSLSYFRERGLPIVGVEPSAGRRGIAQDGGIEVVAGAFENLCSLALPPVSGIWCGAALRHVPEDHFARVMANVAQLLPSSAPVFLMLELGDDSNWVRLDAEDEEAESFVQYLSEDLINQVMHEKSLEVVERWITEPTDLRPGRWISLIGLKN